MSQEERSELSTELFSDLRSEETEAAAENTEDSDNYVWDNYREDPSFVEKDPEKEDLIVEREATVLSYPQNRSNNWKKGIFD